jgi:hypothetical protein
VVAMTRQRDLFPSSKLEDLVQDLQAAAPDAVMVRTTNYPPSVLDAECLTINVGKGKKGRKAYRLVSTEGLDWGLLESALFPLLDRWQAEGWSVEGDRLSLTRSASGRTAAG